MGLVRQRQQQATCRIFLPKPDSPQTTRLQTVRFYGNYLSMRLLKRLSTIFLSIVLVGCSAAEVEDRPEIANFEMPYADAPIDPRPDDVRFFERPNLLTEMRNGQTPMPEVVLMESDPWRQVIGSDSPKFVLYEDGKVIYRMGEEYRFVQLSSAELSSLRKSLVTAHDPTLSGGYRVAWASDQPDNNLLFYSGEPVFISVYGSLEEEQVFTRLPRTVRDAFETVRSFRHIRSAQWMPQQVEVMVWPYEYAPEKSIKWNPDWPGLSDPNTVRRGDSYSLFLPSSELLDLRQFLATRNPKGAVEIDGRKWAASIRIPFPQEQLWMAPNLEVIDTQN